jgi:hypothetical protein
MVTTGRTVSRYWGSARQHRSARTSHVQPPIAPAQQFARKAKNCTEIAISFRPRKLIAGLWRARVSTDGLQRPSSRHNDSRAIGDSGKQ